MPSETDSDDRLGSATSPGLETVRVAVMVLLVALVCLRCVTIQVAQRVFDVDPMLAMMPQAGIGPSFGLGLDAALLLLAGIGLLAERRSGRELDARLLWLALVPTVPILWHGLGDVGDLLRGATWLSSMVVAVTMAHLARDARLRTIALGALLAITAPLALRGAHQLLVEHPAMVAHYNATRDAFLADRGWSSDSAAARLYERRLRQPEATGWFGLSNVLSSMMGAAAVALLVALRGRDLRGQLGGVGLLVLVTGIGAAIILLVNGSKGGVGATLLGVAVALLVVLPSHVRRIVEAHAPKIAVGLVGCALLGVIARGALLPESFADERSLLFRWHYMINSTRVISAAPVFGVGPDGFQDAYVAVRDARHVEEVTNAHSALIDWIAALGIFGWAWVVLALLAVRSAGATILSAPGPAPGRAPGDAIDLPIGADDPPVTASAPRDPIAVRTGRLAAIAALLPAVAGIAIETPTLDGASLLLRALGAVTWVGVAGAIAAHGIGFFDRLDAPRRYALFGAVIVLAVHAQIEMTLWLSGSVGWIMAFVAVIAAPAMPRVPSSMRQRQSVLGPVSAAIGVTALIAGAVLWTAVRVAAIDGALIGAAVPLERLGEARQSLRTALTVGTPATTARAEVAFRAAGVPEATIAAIATRLHHPEAGQRAVGERTGIEALREREMEVRASTAETLESAPRHPGDARALLAASEQWMRLAAMVAPERRVEPLRRAVAAADEAIALSPRIRTLRQRAEALDAIARTTQRHDAWVDAAVAWREVVRRDPHGLSSLQRFAESAWAAGDAVEAERAWRRVLATDEALVLDPIRRLSPDRRAEVLARLSAIDPPPQSPWRDGDDDEDDDEDDESDEVDQSDEAE